MVESHRLFNCARCRCQVRICTRCDRGNVYCSKQCAGSARRESVRWAGVRYQRTDAGKRNHASRQNRYRQRQIQKVTHQGSDKAVFRLPPSAQPAAKTLSVATTKLEVIDGNQSQPTMGAVRCDFCRCPCGPFTRLGPLRHWPVSPRRRRRPRLPVDRGRPGT